MVEETKKRLRLHLNIGTVIFLLIVIYLAASVVRDLGREKLAVYEVGESEIYDEIKGTGLAIREESLETMIQDGFINYYLKEGARVRQGGVIYTIDTTGQVTAYLQELTKEKKEISSEEKKKIFEDLKSLSENFTDDHFAEVYNVSDTLNYDQVAYSDTLISENKKKLIKKFGKDSYIEVKSPRSGLISYYSDGMESLSLQNMDASAFRQKAKMTDLRTRESVAAGSPVYRLVSSQKWEIVLAVSEDEYNRLSDLAKRDINTLKVTFVNDNFTSRATVRCEKKGDDCYAVLTFEDYVQRYMNSRYLSIRLLLSETKGLKIPSSSLIEKEVYRIPERFLTKSRESDGGYTVNILEADSKGGKEIRKKDVTVYQREDGYASISTDGLENDDIICSEDKKDRFTLVETAVIQGVYMVNRGYAVFKPVTIVRRNDDYCIVSPENSGIVLYDRIILNSNTIKENDVIY